MGFGIAPPTLGQFVHVESDVAETVDVPEAVQLGLLDIQAGVKLLLQADRKEDSSNIAQVNAYLLSLLTTVKLMPRGAPISSVDIVFVEDRYQTELGKIVTYLESIAERVKQSKLSEPSSALLLADDAAAVGRPSRALAAIADWKRHFTHLKSGKCCVPVGPTLFQTRLLLQRRR